MAKIQIKLINHSETDIIVDNGIVQQLDTILDNNVDYVVITDENIYHYYKDLIKKQFENLHYNIIVCPNGEQSKNFDFLKQIYSDIIDFGCNRESCLIAFGGGVIGDITGFIASTFMRGISYINIPTTLLSMVDSSIGGKTGFNLDYGKNLIGTIYQPTKVIIDPELLNSLPIREYHSGMAEVIKYGLILDKELFIKLEDNLEILTSGYQSSSCLYDLIINCIKLKVEIVKKDERDNGIRNILNFGHTIGHALESFLGNDYLRHGEAVAYGMLYASKISKSHGNLPDEDLIRINNVINKLNLPELKNIKINKILSFIKNDKKRISRHIRFILLNNIGSANISENIDYNNIELALKDYEYISY